MRLNVCKSPSFPDSKDQLATTVMMIPRDLLIYISVDRRFDFDNEGFKRSAE